MTTPEPIRAVHFRYFFLGLTENWIYHQITGLKNVLVKVYSAARKNKESYPFRDIRCLWEDLGYLTLFFNRAWHKFFYWYPQFIPWLRQDRPDLVHAHFGPCGCEILPPTSRLNIPLITSFYGADAYLLPKEHASWSRRYRKLFRRGRLFLVEGPAMRKKLIELGCPPEKVIIHHIGVKLEKYELKDRSPDGEIRLMVCGRFKEKKGIPYAVEALKKVKSRVERNVCLTVVGDSDSEGTLTDEKRKILHSIEKHGVADSVRIIGYVPHDKMLDIARDHHIFLAPSVHASDGDAEGGFPVILTEVLATGMPVVASDHCDIPHIIRDGKCGFIVPEGNADALAERIEYLIKHPEIWSEMGRAGRQIVEKDYDITKLNRRLVEIYHGLLKDSYTEIAR